LDVSDEFRQYAERVAQGEELPPFEGRILAEPNPTFPWEPSARRRANRRALRVQIGLWGSAAVVVGLISWSLAARLRGSPVNPPPVIAHGAPSEAVLAIQGTTELPAEEQPGPAELAQEDAPSIEGSAGVEPLASEPAAPVVAATPAPAPAPPAAVAPRAPQSSAPQHGPNSSGGEASAEADLQYSHVPPPGALREALGALLAARAAPGEFPLESSAEAGAAGAAPASSVPASPGSPGTPPSGQSPAGSQSPAPGESAAAPVRKEPGNEASGKDSLLVETPSF
jgi:hypothetical protein